MCLFTPNNECAPKVQPEYLGCDITGYRQRGGRGGIIPARFPHPSNGAVPHQDTKVQPPIFLVYIYTYIYLSHVFCHTLFGFLFLRAKYFSFFIPPPAERKLSPCKPRPVLPRDPGVPGLKLVHACASVPPRRQKGGKGRPSEMGD